MKSFKRIAALCLAVGMILTAASTALAATVTGKLVVHGNKEFVGKTVTAIRMFSATYQDGATGTSSQIDEGDSVSYELETAWEGLFALDSDDPAKIDVSGAAGDTLAEKAYDYVRQLTDGNETSTLVTFAKQAAAYAKTNNLAAQTAGTPPLAYSATAEADADGKGTTATFETMEVGYYLVLPEGGSTSVDRQTDAMLVNVPSARSVNLNMKSEYPTVTKEASDTDNGTYGENTTAQIGDTVYFKLTSKVPDMTAYTTYTFQFKDTLSTGLTFDADSVVVKVGDATLGSGTDYTVTPTEDTAGTIVTIDLSSSIKNQIPGKEIVVTYEATLNKNAVIGATANGNSATVEYSNDPGTEETGTSIPDTTKTYTYDIQVHKYATGDDTGYLAGATFILSASETLAGTPTAPDYEDANAIKLVGSGNTYRVAKEDEEGAKTYFTTNGTGNITINGLEAGTYYLHEVDAPDGYNKLTEPVKVEIKVTGEEGDNPAPSYDTPVYVISIDNVAQPGSTNNVVGIENKSGAMLPETGGIGTIGLTVAGVAVVLLGIFLPRRKKKNGKSNGSKA